MPSELSLTNTPVLLNRLSPCAELQDQRQRNLINQRNFRSRRKEYVIGLEKKIREYEQAGIAATRHVQAAARVVAAENALLRNLIMTQLGWSEQELDCNISQIKHNERNSILEETHGNRHYCRCQETPQGLRDGCEQQLVASPNTPPLPQQAENWKRENKNDLNEFTPQIIPLSHIDHDNVRDLASNLPACTSATRRSGSLDNNLVHQVITTSGGQADAMTLRHSQNQEVVDEEAYPDTSMSCEQAAVVLSELRTQGSLELIREELGCASLSTCKVTYWELFQKLDDSV